MCAHAHTPPLHTQCWKDITDEHLFFSALAAFRNIPSLLKYCQRRLSLIDFNGVKRTSGNEDWGEPKVHCVPPGLWLYTLLRAGGKDLHRWCLASKIQYSVHSLSPLIKTNYFDLLGFLSRSDVLLQPPLAHTQFWVTSQKLLDFIRNEF